MRKNVILILSFILAANIYSQVYKCSKEECQKRVYEFALENIDSIKKNNAEVISVLIKFNENYQVEKLYFSNNFDRSSFNTDSPSIDIWEPLKLYIETAFSFCPDEIFRDDIYQITNSSSKYKFAIPLSRENLILCIDSINGWQKKENLRIKNSNKRNRKSGNNTFVNCKFKLVLDTLVYSNKIYPKLEIIDNLNIYSSEILEIAPGFYFCFRLIETSGNEDMFDRAITKKMFIEYKLYSLNRKNIPDLILNSKERIYDKQVVITYFESITSSDSLERSSHGPDNPIYYYKLRLKINLE